MCIQILVGICNLICPIVSIFIYYLVLLLHNNSCQLRCFFHTVLKKERILTSTCMDINANLVRVLISIFCIDQNLIGCLYRTDHRFILYCTYWFYWCRIDARLDKLVVKGIRCHGNRLKVEKLVIIRSFKSNRKLCQDI